MPARPLLSVVVPTHDVAPWIDELLESILAQGVDDMEVVVVDDRSGDDTRDRVLAIAARDSRVSLVESPSAGGGNARNHGVESASGRYLVFADGDDLVPRGAYRAMVDSLERTGSDLAIGDHLKFSPSLTWSPTARWTDLAEQVDGATAEDVPWAISGRACWNKLFRRSFWDRTRIEFPEVPRSNDIVPMTRAILAASSIDVVPRCVYLYRDRPGRTSMTARASADAAASSYFRQEAACAALVREHAGPAVGRVYSRLVFDADAWVHLSSWLRRLEPDADASADVVTDARAVLTTAPDSAVDEAGPDKRALALLVVAGEIDVARDFALRMDEARVRRSHDAASLGAWVAALDAIDRHPGALPGVDRVALATDGLGVALANDADHVHQDESEAFAVVVRALRVGSDVSVPRPAGRLLDASPTTSAVLRAVVAGARRGAPQAVARASAARRAAPLRVDHIEAGRRSLQISGPVGDVSTFSGARLVARSGHGTDVVELGPVEVVPAAGGAARWTAGIHASTLPRSGRYPVEVRVVVDDGLVLDLPVATTPMPIAPLSIWHDLQGLSDRRKGRALVVDRRSPLVKRVARRTLDRLRASVTTPRRG